MRKGEEERVKVADDSSSCPASAMLGAAAPSPAVKNAGAFCGRKC